MDQSYFDRVYEATYGPLLKYAIVHLSDPTDAEDALQNVYLAFYRRIERYGHLDVLFPKAFLLKMLKREIIEQYAEREKHAVRPLEDVPQERLKDDCFFEDGVLDRQKLDAGIQYLPAGAVIQVIPGGNHAQFGSYGPQKGDGTALISPAEQWAETAALIGEVFGG